MQEKDFVVLAKKYKPFLKKVISLKSTSRFAKLDLSNDNRNLTDEMMADINSLSTYINQQISNVGAGFGIGGYLENRKMYQNSPLFDAKQRQSEPRTVHLGIDIWGPVDTQVFAPLGGTVHSFACNNNRGDYGATIILQHQLEGFFFHTLYGHLSIIDLNNLSVNNYISPGICLGHFGAPNENGGWPPHLHFQVILDMQMKTGDYPGVCTNAQKVQFQLNCPDPELILQLQNQIL